ncbi:hypothetical protein AAEX28_10760 [Lentisphaerota bacterium WC36G]|nr:hypothetical protein LJT99_13605 [Lentisphaerae bacterium WC36]
MMTKEDPKSSKKKSKFGLKKAILSFIAGFFLLILLILSTLLAMIFSSSGSLPKNNSKVSSNTFNRLALASKLAAVQGKFFTHNQKDTFTLRLSKNEVNLFFKMFFTAQRSLAPNLLNIKQLKDFSDKKVNCFIEENQLIVGFSGKSKYWTPFGSYINIRANVTPYIKDGTNDIKVTQIKAGTLSVPACDLANDIIKKELEKPKNSKYVKVFKKFSISDNVLTISINRKEFFELVPIEEYLKFIYELFQS